MNIDFGKHVILRKSPDQHIVDGKVRPLILQSTEECKTPSSTTAFVKSHRASIDNTELNVPNLIPEETFVVWTHDSVLIINAI